VIRAAVLGGNVTRSLSPVIHQAAYRALGMQGSYEAFSVQAAEVAPLVRRLAATGYHYVNVTIPHKRAAARAATARSPLVRKIACANTLLLGRGTSSGARRKIRAENTDGYGVLAALAALGVDVQRGQTHVLVGAGGASAGAMAALLDRGAAVRIVVRRPGTGHALRRILPPGARARVEIFPWTPEGLTRALAGAGVLISAVPAEAWQPAARRQGLSALDRGTAVLEMAYGASSPLAAAARARRSRYQDGIPRLVHQAARAIELALGILPPVALLLRAARHRQRNG
jgi:shikimate dehydrogenase